jgi:hypothetical protein
MISVSLNSENWPEDLNDKLCRLPIRWLGPFDLDRCSTKEEPRMCVDQSIRHALIRRFLGCNRELRRFARRILPLLLPWAHISLGVPAGAMANFRIRHLICVLSGGRAAAS